MYYFIGIESELSAWDEDTLIRQNWAEDEVDKLTTVGHEMGALLGSWFQQKAHAELESVTSPPRWRCSESGRGKESGFDFKNGFNSGNIKEVQYKASCLF